MKHINLIDIAEVSKLSGVPASALRYYEEKGLIDSVGRKGLRRVFDSDVLDRLSIIAMGRSAGFSLDEIEAMFTPGGSVQIDRDKLMAKAGELDQTIKKLTALRSGLCHIARCPEQDHLDCPTFRRLMGLASRNQARRTRAEHKPPRSRSS